MALKGCRVFRGWTLMTKLAAIGKQRRSIPRLCSGESVRVVGWLVRCRLPRGASGGIRRGRGVLLIEEGG